jgi:hypothetical protein
MKVPMLRIVLAFVVGLIVLPLFGWLYFRFGYATVATASSPMPFEKQLAHIGLNARIEKEAPTARSVTDCLRKLLHPPRKVCIHVPRNCSKAMA